MLRQKVKWIFFDVGTTLSSIIERNFKGTGKSWR